MQGAHNITPSIDDSGRKDSILSILDNLALCLVRTEIEIAAVSLFGKRLEFAGQDQKGGQVPQVGFTTILAKYQAKGQTGLLDLQYSRNRKFGHAVRTNHLW